MATTNRKCKFGTDARLGSKGPWYYITIPWSTQAEREELPHYENTSLKSSSSTSNRSLSCIGCIIASCLDYTDILSISSLEVDYFGLLTDSFSDKVDLIPHFLVDWLIFSVLGIFWPIVPVMYFFSSCPGCLCCKFKLLWNPQDLVQYPSDITQ